MRKRRPNYQEYYQSYFANRYEQRMELARNLLGNACANCGATDTYFEIDHIDPATKRKDISSMTNYSLKKFKEELAKCQLLCKTCHAEKHYQQEHGTLTMYRYCKCDLCKAAKEDYNKQYGESHRATNS